MVHLKIMTFQFQNHSLHRHQTVHQRLLVLHLLHPHRAMTNHMFLKFPFPFPHLLPPKTQFPFPSPMLLQPTNSHTSQQSQLNPFPQMFQLKAFLPSQFPMRNQQSLFLLLML